MRAILFDKDGTLIDFQASWSKAFTDLALELADGDARRAEELLRIGGMDAETGHVAAGSVLAAGNTLDIVRHWFPGLTPPERTAMVARVDARFYENGISCSVLLPGIAEALALLAAEGIVMGVATSDGTAGTRAALKMLGIDALLPHVFGYDSVARPKPAPDIVHAFSAATSVPVSAIAMVGDNRHDLEMAHASGATAVGVLSGTSRREDLAPLAEIILDSVRDLPGWLRSRR